MLGRERDGEREKIEKRERRERKYRTTVCCCFESKRLSLREHCNRGTPREFRVSWPTDVL